MHPRQASIAAEVRSLMAQIAASAPDAEGEKDKRDKEPQDKTASSLVDYVNRHVSKVG